jgi:oxygen-independent coproporphyrinogen-3 oxidase
MSETVILGLRLLEEGVSHSDFVDRFGCTLHEMFGEVIAPLIDLGLLRDDEDALRLTERAYLVSNQVFMRFLPES